MNARQPYELQAELDALEGIHSGCERDRGEARGCPQRTSDGL